MAEETPQSIFKGKVVANDGTPLSGVNVTIKSSTSISDVVATVSETNVSNVAETTIPTKIDKSITTDDKGEWQLAFPTTDITNPENLTVTFEKENYDLSTIKNVSQTSETTLTLDIPLSESIPVDNLSPSTQEALKKYNQNNTLVLIRDGRIEAGHPFAIAGTGGRTLGAIYYKEKLVAYSIEDIVRFDKKVDHETAIPAGEYYVTLDATGNSGLVGNYVNLKGKGKHPANWPTTTTKGVFARVGNDNPSAVNVVGGKITFGGSRIHAGTNETHSSGCIIVASSRDNKGVLISEQRKKSYEMTKLIYDNDITRIIVINDFGKRTFKKEKK
jgi:hypothetical protein